MSRIIHLIVGARPNFMKMAPLFRAFEKHNDKFIPRLIHTGQHYDERMSKFFFEDLMMPKPHKYLGVGSGSHGEQTARIMERYEAILLEERPDLVLVAGDVNSTVACALDAVKLHIPVGHVEAGLRSFDRGMPEEINRLVTDAISDYLFTPSLDGNENLLHEGVAEEKIHFVGNIMIDSLTNFLPQIEASAILQQHCLEVGEYALITLHRPSNVDNQQSLEMIAGAFEEISSRVKLIFPIHPRTVKNIAKFGLEERFSRISNLFLTEPVGYYDFIRLERDASFVLTDSGGLQEETTWFGVPCLTLRENTERPITVTEGTNQLVKLDKDAIIELASEILDGKRKPGKIPNLWDGKTADRIVSIFS
ncbi:MAG: UDP-N-acetylglucosamine 2-epimerase (non-hydrolyzing) [Candidatus Cloacimonetes bacterium]|nr:UDP-N-acetylglucosamine 2-epimerase (non-hydrolyzing) [Candidatus Cloacimonadota bacterium]